MKQRKTIFDDGFQDYLVDGAEFEGGDGIPKLLGVNNAEVPSALVSFTKAKTGKFSKGYIHFYTHDHEYGDLFTNTRKYDALFDKFDGIITPDPTIVIGKSRCLHAVATYMNRAIGLYEQRRGVPVICNVRWGDPSTYDFCFLGAPKHSLVSISTHGVIARDKSNGNLLRRYFKTGLGEMISRLEPRGVIVYGFMPKDIFGDYIDKTHFYRFPSEFELTHPKKEDK